MQMDGGSAITSEWACYRLAPHTDHATQLPAGVNALNTIKFHSVGDPPVVHAFTEDECPMCLNKGSEDGQAQ